MSGRAGMAIQGGVIFACVAAYFFLKKKKYTDPSICRYSYACHHPWPVGWQDRQFYERGRIRPSHGALDTESCTRRPHLAYKTYGPPQPLWPAEVMGMSGRPDHFLPFDLVLLLQAPQRHDVLSFILCFIPSCDSFLNFFRGDYGTYALDLKSAQITALIGFVIAAAFFIYFYFKNSIFEEPKAD